MTSGKSRAKNLTDSDIEDIIGILDGWSGKLTWDLLVEAIEKRKTAKYTRQALFNHERIKAAFQSIKKSPAKAPKKFASTPELQAAMDTIDRLSSANERLKLENNLLLEQFVRWSYNAHTRGLSEGFLNQPLPDVNREASKKRR